MSTPVPPASPAPGAATNPAEIAREAFKRLAIRRISPTPDAYRDIYNEIVGLPPTPPAAAPIALPDTGAEVVLNDFAVTLSATPGELADFGRRMNRAVKARDWDGYARSLSQLRKNTCAAPRRSTPWAWKAMTNVRCATCSAARWPLPLHRCSRVARY